MKRTKRQNAASFWTNHAHPRVRLRPQPMLARMGQVDPESRSVHILARRVVAEGLMKVSDIDGKISGTRFTRADERSSRRWAAKEPDLPERMVRKGQMCPEDFPPFVRKFLRQG